MTSQEPRISGQSASRVKLHALKCEIEGDPQSDEKRFDPRLPRLVELVALSSGQKLTLDDDRETFGEQHIRQARCNTPRPCPFSAVGLSSFTRIEHLVHKIEINQGGLVAYGR